MNNSKINSPLLGYNTNVRHKGKLFHIQTEDSGAGHPHIITHLFVEGTILATKRTSYGELLNESDFEDRVRLLMKDQHKAMFMELREGIYDKKTGRVSKTPGEKAPRDSKAPKPAAREADAPPKRVSKTPKAKPKKEPVVKQEAGVRVILPADIRGKSIAPKTEKSDQRGSRKGSIFTTPDSVSEFGGNLISDKSLDEVILSFVKDDLEE